MKFKLIILITMLFSNIAFAQDFTGRWAEKISERVVADIYKAENNEYKIFITWREDNLAQKDIYRFSANLDKKGNLKYKNGIHIYRNFNPKGKYEDILDYKNGSGMFKIKNKELIWIDNKNLSENTSFIPANKDLLKDTTIKNKLFSITLPEELKGIYETKIEKNKISIFHKESKKAGFGGFAFGLKAYKNPSDHANLPGGVKIGELTDKKGVLYDMVLKYPTDVQYDYTKGSEAPEDFKILYDIAPSVNIEGIKGAIYHKNQGMKGNELYREILGKHITAIKEKWNSDKLEKENMSYMYNVISKTHKNVLDKIGYTYYDANADGVEELLIGEIAKGNYKGVIYDIYTMVDRKPAHVISGGTRNRFYACDIAFVCNEYSQGAQESGVRVYNLVENSTELFPQVSFKYDGYENSKNPYFLSYSDGKWENVSKQKYFERKKTFEQYERFDFTPLSSALKCDDIIYKPVDERYNSAKDYFDYSVVLKEFPKNYYYTTVKINKSKERILIITDKINSNKNSYHGLFYYFAKNGFVYPLGYIKSKTPLAKSKNYLFANIKDEDIKFYMSDKKLEIIKSKTKNINEKKDNIQFETIKSADKFEGEFGSPAGNDIKKVTMEGFYFEYHKGQYKRKYIESLMRECIKEGVKTQVQMYSLMVKKLHPSI